jgi:hypothetical protein
VHHARPGRGSAEARLIQSPDGISQKIAVGLFCSYLRHRMHVDEFLTYFPDADTSGGQHGARCPAHADEKASLSIGFQNDRIPLHCHADCATADVLRAVGLRAADLFVTNGATTGKIKSTKRRCPAKQKVGSRGLAATGAQVDRHLIHGGDICSLYQICSARSLAPADCPHVSTLLATTQPFLTDLSTWRADQARARRCAAAITQFPSAARAARK